MFLFIIILWIDFLIINLMYFINEFFKVNYIIVEKCINIYVSNIDLLFEYYDEIKYG